MKSIPYTITDQNGIHARPAGHIVQCAKRFSSAVTVEKDGRFADAKKLISLMQLGVRCGDTVTLSADGADEDEAVAALHTVLRDAGL